MDVRGGGKCRQREFSVHLTLGSGIYVVETRGKHVIFRSNSRVLVIKSLIVGSKQKFHFCSFVAHI